MIQTRSSFYYVDEIIQDTNYLNFDEGSGELTAIITPGAYTLTELAPAVETALNSVGVNTYEVSFDRETRKFTIEADASFALLIATGSNVGSDIFPVLGFLGADTASGVSHESNEASGTEYRPQFYLQEWIDAIDNKKSISPAVVKTASGDVEVVKFGDESFFEFNIMLATDIDQGSGNIIETDLNGVVNLRSFLQFCSSKKNLEFMPDRDTVATFYKVLLESSESSSDGTGFRLKEMYDKGLPGYYSSGKLIFRLRE